MAKDGKGCVLVVEDDAKLARYHRRFLEHAGYEVVVTDSKSGALDHLRNRSFVAAVVDLQLRDDTSHKGGLDILEYIRRAEEQTKAVVFSGTPEVRDAVSSFEAGMADFIIKGTAKSERLIKSIEAATKQVGRPLYGRYASLTAYLAAPEITQAWDFRMVKILNCKNETLKQILRSELNSHLPVLRKADGSPSFEFNETNRAVSGLFWSKGAGYPIWFSLCAQKGQLTAPSDDMESTLVKTRDYGKTTTGLWRVIGVKRDIFPEFVLETPWGDRDE